MRFPRYKQNLWTTNDYVVSYGTPVAHIQGDTMQQLPGLVSVTTQRHINYVAEHLGLKLRKPKNT